MWANCTLVCTTQRYCEVQGDYISITSELEEAQCLEQFPLGQRMAYVKGGTVNTNVPYEAAFHTFEQQMHFYDTKHT